MRTIRATTILTAAAALLLAGCGGDEASEAMSQLSEAIPEEAEDDPGESESPPEPAEAGAADDDAATDESASAPEAVTVDGREMDATVHHAGLEYTFSQMTVNDLDAEASPDGEVEDRVQGIELVFEVSVFNPSSDTMNPMPQASLRWDEPGTENVIDVPGSADFRQVPGDSSSSGEIVVPVSPADLEVYDDASAKLLVGQSGQSAAQVPLGTDADLITRFPVQQAGLVDEEFDVSDVLVTITAAEVRWDRGDGSQVEDGTALLELTYTMDNQGDSQSCSTRGEGAFALTLPDGDGIVDLGVTDRCARGGEVVTDARTGFDIDADYAGEYTLRHERGDETDEFTFTLEDGDGAPASERETR